MATHSPIVIFAYKRLTQIKKLLESLSLNEIAHSSDLYIFLDGPKNSDDAIAVNLVHDYLLSLRQIDCFKSVNIEASPINKGLASSIISGVTKVLSCHSSCIVVEDDVIVSKDFLDYMNRGLSFYEHNYLVWSIGGHTPMDIDGEIFRNSHFIAPRTSSCAWATWATRWVLVDWKIKDYAQFRINPIARSIFNKYGNDRSNMLDLQMHGKINSWAIRFCYSQFKNKTYTVYPTKTKVENNGFDGLGTHNNTKEPNHQNIVESNVEFKADLKESKYIESVFRKYYGTSRVITFLRYLSSFIKYGY